MDNVAVQKPGTAVVKLHITLSHICMYMLFSLQDSCVPVMTTYKLVIMDAPIWGLGERLEDCIIAVCRYITPC